MAMNDNKKHDAADPDPIEVWETLLDDVAEQAAEDHVTTEEESAWARDVDAMVMRQLEALEPAPESESARPLPGVTIPPGLQALGRPVLIAQLEALRRAGLVRYAHQDLTGLSDNDLRKTLALALAERSAVR
jgi:hypothetical protein